MIRPRIIPFLLIKNNGLVKTRQFDNPKYIGDPINAVRIFNEKCVDELIVLDIDATVKGKDPDLKMIDNLATECRMPLCYGGGIKTVEQIREIIELGVEKVSLSSAAIENPEIVKNGAKFVGNQSIVVTLDVKKVNNNYLVFTQNGKKNTGLDLRPGMTFTIEPMINAGKYEVKILADGWTAVTKDKTLSAQFEHTVGITENGYEIFTESVKSYSKPPYN